MIMIVFTYLLQL